MLFQLNCTVLYSKINRFAAALILLIYVTASVTTRELLKMPFLADHYSNHLSENLNTSFFSFLVYHYVYENDTDKDADEDRKLPFKSTENNFTANSISLKPPVQHINFTGKRYIINCRFPVLDDRFTQVLFNNSIWHPPRIS